HRCHVLECNHGLLVPAPLLDEVGAPLLLHVVVGDLGRGARCHVLPFRPWGQQLCASLIDRFAELALLLAPCVSHLLVGVIPLLRVGQQLVLGNRDGLDPCQGIVGG